MDDKRLAAAGNLSLLLADFLLLLQVNLPFLQVDGVRQLAHAVGKSKNLVFASGTLQRLILVHHVVLDVNGVDSVSLGQIEGVGLTEQADGLVVAIGHGQIAGIATDVIYRRVFGLPVLQVESLSLVALTVCGIDHGLPYRYVVVADVVNVVGHVRTAVQTGQGRVAFSHQRQGLFCLALLKIEL